MIRKIFLNLFLTSSLLLLWNCQSTSQLATEPTLESVPQSIPEPLSDSILESTLKGIPITSPFSVDDFVVLDHKYFKIGYDKSYRLARYVEYTITKDQMIKSKKATRKNAFKADSLLKKEDAVVSKEYTNSGYERGHLANAKDFGYDQKAQDATFVMSNMAPQTRDLNGDAWLKLENQVRKWACGEEKIKVITGPILKKGLSKMKSGLVIPQEFFKVILDETPAKKLLAFIYFQTDKGNVLNERRISKEEIHRKIKPQLKENLIKELENYPIKPMNTWKSYDCFSN